MSDQGDKACPLCAEEMDLTDQQLKPCKCGYEICVWCWHHIMDMAEKDNTDGRCPACRTPYNKEKIVGMAAKCDKVVAEMSTEKRLSSRKGKSKTADSRKQLSNVRVVQRNLVYVMGLPLSLADEDLLQQKEYFSKYGKVLKVSMSRTAAGAIQQFANNTCSVYITYSKEEEAILCIQSVHGFVLDGRPLRACFGTTKYCHAWLRNVPCINPDCLYLHEIGSQEDSFTKDEVISAYTRSRVQQIAGAINSTQQRSGSMLPSPAEEYCSHSSAASGKPISKNAATNSVPNVRGSPPNSSSGRSAALPAGALWGTRASNNQRPPASVPCYNGPLNKKPETCNPAAFSTAVGSTSQVSLLPAHAGKEAVHTLENGTTEEKGNIETLEPVKQYAGADPQTYTSENLSLLVPPASSSINTQLHNVPSLKDKHKHIMPNSTTKAFDISVMSNGPGFAKDSNDTTDIKIQNICSDMSSLSIDRHKKSQRSYIEQCREPLPSEMTGESVVSADEICISKEKSDLRFDAHTKVIQVATPEMEDDLLSFNEQRHRDPEVIIEKVYSPNLSLSLRSPAQPSGYSPQLTNGGGPVKKANMQLYRRTYSVSQASTIESSTNGYLGNLSNCVADLRTINGSYYPLPNEGKRMHVEKFEGEAPSEIYSTKVDNGESSIISNILSLDFDPWNASLTSPQNLAKLLGETDNQQGSLRVSSSRKLTSNQSRFSFAREEEPASPSADCQPSLSYIEQNFSHFAHGHDFSNSRSYQLENIGTRNGFSVANNEESVGYGNSFSHLSSNKLSVSRPQMSAPPGFSAPNRAPPRGFTSHYERMEHNFDSLHGSHLLDTSSLHNQYQAPPVGNVSNGDIEFMDPAILAVGKGRIPSGFDLSSLDMSSGFSPQLSTLENERRLQLLMQRSLTPQQNKRFADMGDNFSPYSDAYGISSRVVEQTLASNQFPFDGISPRVMEKTMPSNQSSFDGISSRVLEQALSNNQPPFSQLSHPQTMNSVMSNGHWDGWNGVQSGNNSGVAELLRTENVGLNKFFTGYEDPKFHMPNSGTLYNRTFGM
ncbi:uncharacterized protein LOC107767333 isoform X1 [Nicotiana tabacum]|uniref:Uncharacterized protein LOC107767333 isoform X1 n=1 Tax=Nicotiana tabacum TaxID=4097 RepID=A0A1S3XPD8_TOBAC